MIAHRTFDAFGDLTFTLGEFAPPDVERPMELGPGEGMLSRQAIPADPSASCIVAVIDHAIPFAHHLLTCATGHSRVAAIWMMDGLVVRRHPDIAFGQHLRGVEIDYLRGLDGGPVKRGDKDLYRVLGLMDAARRQGRSFLHQYSHGASVAGTAAGFEPTDAQGLAHPLIGVGLPDWALADTSGAFMPMLIQAAVCYIVSRARMVARQFSEVAGRQLQLPLVVNISLGVTAGPRDGSSLVERMQDAISRNPPPGLGPVHFVLSTGNSRQDRVNAVLHPGDEIGWQVLPDDSTPSELQIWGAAQGQGQRPIRLRLTLPDGRGVTSAFLPPQFGQSQIARVRDGRGYELARLALQGRGERADRMRQVLTVVLPPTSVRRENVTTAPVGQWQVRLLDGPEGDFDAVVQRDDRLPGFPGGGRQTFFADPAYRPRLPNGQWPGPDPVPPDALIRRDGTCNAFAWGDRQIRCGAALGPPVENPTRISPYSGLLADGLSGDLVSTGDRGMARWGVLAPGMYNGAMQLVSGTSIATPRLVRWLAARLATGAPLDDRAEVIAAARAERPGWADPPRVDPAMPWQVRD